MSKGKAIVFVVLIGILGAAFWPVYQVRHQEAQLEQAMAQLERSDLHMARAPSRMPMLEILVGGALVPFSRSRQYVELMWPGGYLWHPDRAIIMSAVYRTDTSPEDLYAHYVATLRPIAKGTLVDGGYFLLVPVSDVQLQVTIAPREFMPDGEIYHVPPPPLPTSGSVATAVEVYARFHSPSDPSPIGAYPYPTP